VTNWGLMNLGALICREIKPENVSNQMNANLDMTYNDIIYDSPSSPSGIAASGPADVTSATSVDGAISSLVICIAAVSELTSLVDALIRWFGSWFGSKSAEQQAAEAKLAVAQAS